MTQHFFPLTGRSKCEACGGVARVELEVWATGYSVGDGYEHTSECPKTRCPHGVPWAQWSDCKPCEGT